MSKVNSNNPPVTPRSQPKEQAPASKGPTGANTPAHTDKKAAKAERAPARMVENLAKDGFDARSAPTARPSGTAGKAIDVAPRPLAMRGNVVDVIPGSPAAIAAGTPGVAASPSNPITRNVTFVYDAGSHNLTNLQLKGSFNKQTGAFDPNWGGGDTIPMKPLGDGRWSVTVPLQDDGQPHNWQWGVVADGPAGKGQWAMMGETPPSFNLNATTSQLSYAPTTYDRMGAHQQSNGDISFNFWAPDAQSVNVKVTDQQGNVTRIPMTRNDDGTWSADVKKGWDQMVGKSYAYELMDSGGQLQTRPDPYATVMQGVQRGVTPIYVNTKTGDETNYYDPTPHTEFMQFAVQDAGNHDHATLVLRDDTGHQLSKAELLARVGAFDSTMDPSLQTKLRGGQFDDLWSRNVNDDGSINLTREGNAFATLLSNPENLKGLHYEFKVFDKDANGNVTQVIDPVDGKSPGNDPWSDVITADSGKTFRSSVIADTRYTWQNDSAPRELDHSKWVIEQVHVGSLFGGAENTQQSTFKDLQDRLSYFKSLGVNTIELLPVNQFEGNKDWGYMGASSLAVDQSYGYQDASGRWVSGAEALKNMIDEAHRQGLNVINDVVYNHIGGDYNSLWNLDGKENPYFNWSTDPSKMQQRDTPWGAMPAYDNPKVSQFLVDNAVSQAEQFHFDGLRFDFTQPMKQDGMGGVDGWNMMRDMNRQLHFFNPNFFTACEQFDYDPNMTRPAQANGAGGAGFDATWYTEYQHRLVHDNDNPSIIQQAANGQQTNMDAFMNMLTNPRGLDSWKNAVTIMSDHDEVGNGERTINVADNNATGLPPQYSRDLARFAAGIGLASPGIPMFFQGDESMAQNTFKWGNPSTWDLGWSWQSLGKSWDWKNVTFNDQQKDLYNRLFTLPPDMRASDPGYQSLSVANKQVFNDLAALSPNDRDQAMVDIARKQTFEFYQDAIKLRESSPAFDADASVQRVYTHNDNSVMAFTRQKGNDQVLVVGSLNHNNLSGYQMPLPPGQWKEVFNSDAATYGGSNFGNFGATINGGNSSVNIPSGGYVVFEKVG